ncbi:hypothetical protein MTO96_010214 [Rhipicephalus appendiculatus]
MSVRTPPGPNLEYDHSRVLTWLQDWMSVSTVEDENLGPPPMNHYATISSLGHRSVRSAPRDYVDPDYVVSELASIRRLSSREVRGKMRDLPEDAAAGFFPEASCDEPEAIYVSATDGK